jgi:ATP-binding cassette, subfamily B, bacterial
VRGVDLRQWDLDAWRGTVRAMPQDVFLFQATIAENIAYGCLEASRAEIEEAARESGGEQLVQRFPHDLETMVGERGATLSGGERQLVALARFFFLRKPRLLLLDEPTPHLDGEALHQVGIALKRRMADRILLLDRGRLLATGTHEALLAQSVLYRKLLAEMDYTSLEVHKARQID